jgi:hypothetical protein
LFNNQRRPSILEMWNLIESVGIKRELVAKAFTTDEAVSELYNLVYKRIHYEREQDMIRRLRVYVEKLKDQESMKSVEEVPQKSERITCRE